MSLLKLMGTICYTVRTADAASFIMTLFFVVVAADLSKAVRYPVLEKMPTIGRIQLPDIQTIEHYGRMYFLDVSASGKTAGEDI